MGGAVRPVVGAGEHIAPVEDAEFVVHQPVFDYEHALAGRFQLGKRQPARLAVRKTIEERTRSGVALKDLITDLMDEFRILHLLYRTLHAEA